MFEKYSELKDSGVSWLGSVPKQWKVLALGSLMELKSDKNHPEFELLSVYREYGVIKKDSRDDNHNATSEDTTNYKAVQPGDLVVNKMKAWQGSMGVSPYKGIVSPAYITCRINSCEIVSEYLHQLLRCNSYIGEYNRISYGVRVGQWDMHFEDFKRVPVLVPSRGEQTAIANFLDLKTAQIDQAISIKEKQIELLKERRQILIHNAVTRGLDPDVKMKDSGVQWIGEIPEHWEVKKLKYILAIRNGQINPKIAPYKDQILIAPNHIESRSGRILYKESADSQGADSGKYLVKIGDIIYSKIRPELRKVCMAEDDGLCSADMYPMTVLKGIDAHYVKYIMLGEGFNRFMIEQSMRVAMPKVNREDVLNFEVAVPATHEQIELVKFMDRIVAKVEVSISLKQKEIEKLKEYKSTLINSAVTGKIKVA